MIVDRTKFLWISTSPSLKCFHRRLLHQLSKAVELEFWEYYQTLDEGSSIDGAIDLLSKYISQSDRPIHLIGHGIGGVIALGYARLHPARVASLTLLSVAAQPAIDWHSYYYTQLRSLPSNRECVLRSIASNLFPNICASHLYSLTERLERDLVEAPSNHSLFRLDILAAGGVKMPLMICASQDDPVVSSTALSGWNSYLKSTDTIYCTATGKHFFHHFHPELVSHQIQQFWQKLSPESALYQLTNVECN
ncbi:alpha/beta hydrolase [Chamaesiphon sp. VAR_69_metabat_338]|uniref:alpha/beta fold hydrolase n=1 Tax=Chamaesiphon sp. VAR_69_metabat_338 TaxID=2964704 RepID=UPI00286E58D6|nr:alpha/beta hydrolase [Chamaesiphon sp. VAR_69_metabat_338]